MPQRVPHTIDDQKRQACEAIDKIAEGLKTLYCLSLDHQAGEPVNVEASTPIGAETRAAAAPILTDKRELTVKELAARWEVSERSIYQWKDTHGLPYKKQGRLLRFDWIEVEQWRTRHRGAINNARLRVVR